MSEPSDNADRRPRPFDIHAAMRLVGEAVRSHPKAALFELYEEGHTTPFELLVACIISIRTLDEVMLPVARRLFKKARTPAGLGRLEPDEIDALIEPCTFHERKARQLQAIAQRVEREHGGELPCDPEVILSFDGVGPKCANLVLGIVCGQPRIGVDVHVHRIANRWGYVRTSTPERTMAALEASLPREYWVEINRLLVPFGKHVCTGNRPRCPRCPLRDMCERVGVGESFR